MSGTAAAAVVAAGVAAAIHVGKLPPALAALRTEFGISLVEASFLVSVLQIAAVLVGVFGGMLADRFGHRRVMSLGLIMLVMASLLGSQAASAAVLLFTRMLESAGFLLTVLPGPSLLRRCAPLRLNRWIGLWAAYMPLGMALALLGTPYLITSAGWRTSWLLAALLSGVVLVLIQLTVAPDPPHAPGSVRIAELLRSTLSRPGPWLLALCFGCYAAQWMGVFAFLPTMYNDAAIPLSAAAPLTAFAVAVNILGNLAGGALASRKVSPPKLVMIAAGTMGLMGWLAFGSNAGFGVQYLAICVLSMVGGLIPGALFVMTSVLAPNLGTVSTTVGLMQQGSALGQMVAPPILATVVSATGGWSGIWWVTAGFALADLLVGLWLLRLLSVRR